MKKITTIIIILLTATFFCVAGNGRNAKSDGGVRADMLTSLISEYRGREGFDVIKIGRLGTSAIKTIARLGALGDDEDAAMVRDVVGGLKKLAIVDYEDCSDADKQSFERKVNRLLKDDEVIMEFKDGGDICRVYGVMDEKSDKIRDFILYTPSDCALICLFGSISLNKVLSTVD